MSLLSGTALVTGSGSGIGRELALAYVRAGIENIALADVNLESIAETARLIEAAAPKKNVLQITVDVTDEVAVKSMVDKVVSTFGSLDCAANAAGIIVNKRGKGAEVSENADDYERVMAVNAKGVMLCMGAEARAMLKQPRKTTHTSWADERRGQVGSIVNFASVCGFAAMPQVMAYTASKHAVMGITRSAALDHAGDGLRINAVCPGVTDTPFLQNLRKVSDPSSRSFANPMGRLCLPEEIADVCVFLSSSMASYVNGAAIIVDGSRSAEY